MSAAALEQIAKEVAVCTKCSLCKTRTKTVPGEGSPKAEILFIGEAPGYHEDMQGRPFVGNSGDLLNRMFKALKIARQDVFIANVVKCRPPNNADPTPDQIAACREYLDRQIEAINPRMIVTLGRFSMARWWPSQRISQIHGQPKTENGRLLLPMFHPSAALREQFIYDKFKADALTIPALLEEARALPPPTLQQPIFGVFEPTTTEPELAVMVKPRPVEPTAALPKKIAEPKPEYVEAAPPEVVSPVQEAATEEIAPPSVELASIIPQDLELLVDQQNIAPTTEGLELAAMHEGNPATDPTAKSKKTRPPKKAKAEKPVEKVETMTEEIQPVKVKAVRKRKENSELGEQLRLF